MRALRWFAATLLMTALAGGSLASASPVQRSLDASFGFQGKVTTRIGEESRASAVAQQKDGKIVVAGWTRSGDTYDFALARYRRNGALDLGFGKRGIVTTDFGGWDLASAMKLQRDGKILVAGDTAADSRTHLLIARYTRRGALDRTFGIGGTVTSADASAQAMVVQADGRIVTGGGSYGDFALSRFMPDGSPDTSFGTDGIATVTFPISWGSGIYGLALQPNGKIVAVGVNAGHETAQWALARFLRNGRPDPSFGTGGKVTLFFEALSNSAATAVGLQHDGTIVVAGDTSKGATLVRLKQNGSLASTSFQYGFMSPTAIRIQRDDKIVLAGSTWDGQAHGEFALARYTRRGVPDGRFWGEGMITTSITPTADGANALVIQRDRKIVLAGFAGRDRRTFALVRYAKR